VKCDVVQRYTVSFEADVNARCFKSAASVLRVK